MNNGAITEGPSDSFLADSTAGVVANRRVKLTAGRKIQLAGETDVELGVTVLCVTHSATQALWKVQLRNAAGSVKVEAADDFEQGDVVKRAALGKVSSAGAGANYGIADGDADEAGDVVPVFPL